MSSLQERLRRLGGRNRQAGGESAGESAAGHASSAAGREAGAEAGLPSASRLVDTEEGSFVLRERRYPLTHEHGLYALGDLVGRHERLNRVSRRHAGMRPIESHRGLLFFDTETTGLGIGAGNVPFLIGIGFFEEREFVMQQLFVRDPGEEWAMLHYFRQLADKFTHLVTYNGKSFDWPLLANRYVLNRIAEGPAELEHLDLLYIARSLWKNSLESCRLSRVEEARLGIMREGDVPGSLVPMIYFQYLADGDFAPLEDVFRHNEWDVLSLASLSAHLGALLSGDAEWDKLAAEDLYRAGLWLLESGLPDLAELPFATLLERPAEAANYAAQLAMAYKKMRRYDKAVPLWEQAAARSIAGARLALAGRSLEPLVELAIYHEHHSKQLAEALRWTDSALQAVERVIHLYGRSRQDGNKARQWQAELLHRRNRLTGKLRKQAGRLAESDRAGESGSGEWEIRAAAGSEAIQQQLEWDWQMQQRTGGMT